MKAKDLSLTRSALARYDWGGLERFMNWAEVWANPADIRLRELAMQEDRAALLDVQIAFQTDTGSTHVPDLGEIRRQLDATEVKVVEAFPPPVVAAA